MTCPSCSAPAPEEAHFCPNCGHALHVPGDERRIVTVVFGDVVGFTALSESRDPETVKNLLDSYFERLTADIVSFGGRVDKIVGDAVVALFGAPTAHEDDAERAVRAALAMQRSLDDQAEILGAPVRMRIGVNTGEVLVGALRAGGDYTAMGDVVNTASRLQTAAQPGQVIVGPETYAATRDVFRYEPLGSIYARGRDEPVEAWAAIEPVAAPGRRPRRAEVPLIGRDAEVGLLRAAVSTAVTYRRPQLALLVGEAGMGKSRLAEEIAAHAREVHGAVVLEGHSLPYGEANVWWPLADALRQAFGIEPGETAADTRAKLVSGVAKARGTGDAVDLDVDGDRIVEALAFLFGHESRLAEVESSRARDEVARAVRGTLVQLGRQHPVVLVISDVQWADPLVLELVDGLLDQVHRVPLIVLLTARPELETRWRPTAGRHNLVVLNLDPLDARAARRLLVSLLGREPDAALEAALLERSGGNPFFLEELAALLDESGALATGTTTLPVLPATLRGLVAARLDSLPARERAVLEDAAVLGRRGPVGALVAMADAAGREPIRTGLAGLIAKDLLSLRDGQIGFASDLVREVAYGTLTKAARARRHAHLASWLERAAAEKERSDELLEELARHYATAAELTVEIGPVHGVPDDILDRALLALDGAAERAEDRETALTSARLFEQQLRLLGPGADPRRRHALIGRARALTTLRRLDEARADLEVALSEADGAGDDVARARALTTLGELEGHAGDFGNALTTLDEAVELWRGLGDRRGEAAALRRRGMALLFAGRPDLAEESLEEALAAFEGIGSRKGLAWANQNLAWIAFTRGQGRVAEERLRAAIDLFGDIGDWGGLGWALGLLGWVQYAQGHTAEAERLALRTVAEARELGDRWATAMMTVLLASIRLWQGRAGDAVAQAAEARQQFEDLGDAWGQARALAPLSRALLVLGRRVESDAALAEAEDVAARFPPGSEDAGFPLLLTVEAAVHAGEGEQFATGPGAELLTAERAAMAFAGPDGAVARGLAFLHAGRPDDALAGLEAVLARSEDVGPRAYCLSALALVTAAAGARRQALLLVDELGQLEGGTYLDHTLAALASACASAAEGDERAAFAALLRADGFVKGTDDRLTRAIAALARGRVLEALGRTDAELTLDAARLELAEVGAGGEGWDTAFRLASGLASAQPA